MGNFRRMERPRCRKATEVLGIAIFYCKLASVIVAIKLLRNGKKFFLRLFHQLEFFGTSYWKLTNGNVICQMNDYGDLVIKLTRCRNEVSFLYHLSNRLFDFLSPLTIP